MSAYAAENPQSTWYTGANSIDILSGGDFQVKVPPRLACRLGQRFCLTAEVSTGHLAPPESYVESVNLLIIK